MKLLQAAIASGALLGAGPGPALADPQGAASDQTVQEMEDRRLEFDDFGWPPKGRFGNGNPVLERYVDFNRDQWDRNRISWLVAPTVMSQSGSQGGTDNSTANYQHNIAFGWQPVQNTSWGTGTFIFNFLEVYQLTRTTGVDFSGSLGISYPSSDSVSDSSSLKALYWQQDLPQNLGYVRFGHIELNGVVTQCSYLCDDTQSFISGPLSSNTAGTMPGQGWGIQAGVNFGAKVSLEFGVTDGNGDGKLNTDRAVRSDELAYAGSLTFNDPFPSLGEGSARLSIYEVDQTRSAGAKSNGMALHLEQDVGDVALALRYAQADGRQAIASHTGALAAIWKAPFGQITDQLGIGIGYVQPSTAGLQQERIAEAFYRTQITPLAQLSAGVMHVTTPNNAADTSGQYVLNLRLRAAF